VNNKKIIWLTGQPGSGKTTLANALYNEIVTKKLKAIIIDGDDIRDVLDNKDYSEKGRKKNIQFAIDMAKVMSNKGYHVLVSLVSPYRNLRIGEIFYLESSRKLRKDYWVKDYEEPLENFTRIDTNKKIEDCIDEIFNVYW
tara:strand:- start:197 stop:619 length:423 start_codon:yes stop_codon:yes gene_type:complete